MAAFAGALVLLSAGSSGAGGAASNCTIVGTAAPDLIVGTAKRDVICAGPGDDTVHGVGGDDVVRGDAGDDVLYPGVGRDRAVGGAGNDTILAADRQRDAVDGGAGRDRARTDGDDRRREVEWVAPRRLGPHPLLLAAGDIAACSSTGDDATAALLDLYPRATVAAIGDTAYENGAPDEFARCYEPFWGRAFSRTRPAVGNHEYHTPAAAGYFGYFGARAGSPGDGWYSYDLGTWHVVVLNTNCAHVACQAGSPQERWLRGDLARSRARCTLAYGHHALVSSRENHAAVRPLWRALYEDGAEIVLAGHSHHYERFSPLTPDGAVDRSRGLRLFVVGTGGKDLVPPPGRAPNVEVQHTKTFGVLKLVLRPTTYQWEFVPVAGGTFSDRGAGRCA